MTHRRPRRGLRAQIETEGKDLGERMNAQSEQMSLPRERMARLEGLLEEHCRSTGQDGSCLAELLLEQGHEVSALIIECGTAAALLARDFGPPRPDPGISMPTIVPSPAAEGAERPVVVPKPAGVS